jgi:hypothetical protein
MARCHGPQLPPPVYIFSYNISNCRSYILNNSFPGLNQPITSEVLANALKGALGFFVP